MGHTRVVVFKVISLRNGVMGRTYKDVKWGKLNKKKEAKSMSLESSEDVPLDKKDLKRLARQEKKNAKIDKRDEKLNKKLKDRGYLEEEKSDDIVLNKKLTMSEIHHNVKNIRARKECDERN